MKTWQEKWRNNYTGVTPIKHLYSEDDLTVINAIKSRHPVSVPQYYFNLIDRNDPADPIKKLSFPHAFEADLSGDYDTSGESSNTKLPGLQHKYPPTALVLTTNACFMYCRHCFRKRMVGYTNDEIAQQMDDAINYIAYHEEINNVLLSGGDSMCMTNDQIKGYLEGLSNIEHLDFIRFGTRSHVVFPERIYNDPELLAMLAHYHQKKQIIFISQFNHPNELTEQAARAVKVLSDIGISVNNQTVVLKGVNDNADTMAELQNGLVKIGVMPYYVFQCRPVKAVKAGFQIPLIDAYHIIRKARRNMSGVSKRFKFILSHVRGKVEILAADDDNIYFRFQNAKDPADTGYTFVRKIDKKARWLDQDLNLIE